VACHTKKTGTVSIDEIQERFAKDPEDTLFRSPDSDDLDGLSFTRLLTTGTIKIDVPLAPKRQAARQPVGDDGHDFPGNAAGEKRDDVTAIPDVRRTRIQQRPPAPGVERVHQHTLNSIEPTPEQLDRIAEFERTDERFFSSEALRKFAGRWTFAEVAPGKNRVRTTRSRVLQSEPPVRHVSRRPHARHFSEFDVLIAPGSRFHAAGAGLQLGHLDQAFDADGTYCSNPPARTRTRPLNLLWLTARVLSSSGRIRAGHSSRVI